MSGGPLIRTAVIGYGLAGRVFHSQLVAMTPGLELVGIAARTPETRERIQRERGCRAYASFDEVIADPDVDLVVLGTPSDAHADQAVAAVRAGKHVVTDKPMAGDLAACDRMIAATDAAGRMLSVFHNRRWDGDFLTVQKLMREGPLHRVRRIEMTWAQAKMPGGWRGQAQRVGGRVYDLASHMIDQLCLLLPQPITSVYARLQHDSPDHDVESDAVIVVGFEDGATGIVRTGALGYLPQPRFHLTGLDGAFTKFGLDPQEAALRAGDLSLAVEDPATFGTLNTTGKREDDQTVPTLPGRWLSYYEGIAAHLRDEAPPPVPLDTVRRTMAVLDAVFASARTGEVVRPTL